MRIGVPTGTRRLLVWSAAGTALLGEASDAEIAPLVHRTNAEALNGRERIDLGKVLDNGARFREHGYFFSRGMVTPGGGHVAMRLPTANSEFGQQPHALGVAGWIDRIEQNEAAIVRMMRAALVRHAGTRQTEAHSRPDEGR